MSRWMNVCAFALALLLAALPLAAQVNPDGTAAAPYVVKQGENLWMLAGAKMGDPFLWEKIYSMNPFLREEGRRFQRNGKVIVLLRPGEKLYGLEKLGITPTFAPISSLNLETSGSVVSREVVPDWLWLLLAVLAALAVVAWLVSRMLNRNPATARPAMVEGGVNTPEAATAAFQQMAARRLYHPDVARVQHNYQQFAVVEQTSGQIWGVLNVRYADGREVPRRLNGERAYKATVRFPNERTTEELYLLQECGNDLRYGGISRYLPGPDFRFEADRPAPISESQPAPQSTATEPVAEQTQGVRSMAAAAGAGIAPITVPEPVTARVAEPVAEQPVAAPAATDTAGANAAPNAEPAANGWKLEFKPQEDNRATMVRITGLEVEELMFESSKNVTTFRVWTKTNDNKQ